MSSFEIVVIPEKCQATAENMVSEAISLLTDNQPCLLLGIITTFVTMVADVTGESEAKLIGFIFDAIQHSKSQGGTTLS